MDFTSRIESLFQISSKNTVLNRSYDILHFQWFGRDLALFDGWFQTMSRKMGSDNDIKLKFPTNVSNKHILKVTKFRSHTFTEKSYGKNETGGIKLSPPRSNRVKLTYISRWCLLPNRVLQNMPTHDNIFKTLFRQYITLLSGDSMAWSQIIWVQAWFFTRSYPAECSSHW